MNRPLLSAVTAAMLAVSLLAPARAHTSCTVTVTDLTPASSMVVAAYGVSGDTQVGENDTFATLWTGTAASAVTLGPTGYDFSAAYAVDGDTQGGCGQRNTGSSDERHALLWHGTAASLVDLNPAGYDNSQVLGVSGNTQVGYGYQSGSSFSHALLWTGTPESVVDLTPVQLSVTDAYVYAVSGDTQVGSSFDPGHGIRAVLWHGTAASAVDLNPKGFFFSEANGVDGDTQVGAGIGPKGDRALLWHGTADSVRDLTPSGFSGAAAFAASGGAQVGEAYASTTDARCALLWTGTAQSAVNLNKFLPAGFHAESEADGVQVNGNVVTVAGLGHDHHFHQHAFLWKVTFPDQPTLLQLDPATRTAGRGAFSLIVHGTGFTSRSVVQWNGAAQPTTLVSPFEVRASIPASLTASAGTATVAVTTPGYAVTLSRTVAVHS